MRMESVLWLRAMLRTNCCCEIKPVHGASHAVARKQDRRKQGKFKTVLFGSTCRMCQRVPPVAMLPALAPVRQIVGCGGLSDDKSLAAAAWPMSTRSARCLLTQLTLEMQLSRCPCALVKDHRRQVIAF